MLGGLLPLSAAPFDPGQVSADANWYMHADMDALKGSEAGGLLMRAVTEEHGQQARAFARLFSFNPLEDVGGVTIYGRDDKGVVLLHAQIDPDHLADLVVAADDHQASDHHGVTVHQWKDGDSRQAGAIVDSGLVVFSDCTDLVAEALDVLAGRRASAAEDHTAGDTGGPAIVMAVADLAAMQSLQPDAVFLREARSMRMELGERDGRLEARMELVIKDRAQANRLGRMMNGVFALGELVSPELAELGLQGEMQGDNETGRLSGVISMPSDKVVELMEAAMALQ